VGQTHEILPEHVAKRQGTIFHRLLLFLKRVGTWKAIQEDIVKIGLADKP
jgi:hypothetical protein